VTNFITGVIGIVLVVGFLAFMIVWVPAPPLIIIVVAVMVLLIIDFVQSLRSDNNGR
jgi:Flp pilus assembly protein TadB